MQTRHGPAARLETLRVRSEGRLDTLENGITLCRRFLAALEGRGEAPTTSLEGFDEKMADTVLALERLGGHEPSPELDEVLATWRTVQASLSQVAQRRLEELKMPRPEGFAELVRTACATLRFEFNRPVVDVRAMLLSLFIHLGLIALAGVEALWFLRSEWALMTWPEVALGAAAMAWALWARRRVSRVVRRHVRLSVFGVHAADRFVSFDDIRSGWIGSGGEVVIETRRGERLELETEHAVELQRVLMRHGVKLTTLARRS